VIRTHAPRMIGLLYQSTATLAFGLLFSFLIQADSARLTRLIEGLRHSRLKHFYFQAAEPVSRLLNSIGVGLRAQSMIAAANAALTSFGLMILGVPSIAMLSMIVFLCGLVPVVGTFVSTVPILLLAVNAGGPKMVLWCIGLVVVIHMMESYMLNPLIYGKEFRFNPVLTLIILFMAYHAFGVWGMVLGLPITRYLLRDVFAVPFEADDPEHAATRD
jgi:predicted PurR-regulated permease PerM